MRYCVKGIIKEYEWDEVPPDTFDNFQPFRHSFRDHFIFLVCLSRL